MLCHWKQAAINTVLLMVVYIRKKHIQTSGFQMIILKYFIGKDWLYDECIDLKCKKKWDSAFADVGTSELQLQNPSREARGG